jgi:AP-3 complex subunit beta
MQPIILHRSCQFLLIISSFSSCLCSQSISKGKDVSVYFPEVVKSIITDTHDVKKLVYTFILHYAERKQDEVLLSINSFQKDLTHRNQYIRAMALRVMSSIRVPMISQIVTFGIKKCAKDPSAYVRKAAAMAIPKVYQ